MTDIKTYYLPTYGYRTWANTSTALDDIINHLAKQRLIPVYTDKRTAEQIAVNMLCDDDTCAVITLKVENDYWVKMFTDESNNYDSFKLFNFSKYICIDKQE